MKLVKIIVVAVAIIIALAVPYFALNPFHDLLGEFYLLAYIPMVVTIGGLEIKFLKILFG